MAKMRVQELAKEINTTNKELLDFLKANIEVKSHMSSLSDEQIETVKKQSIQRRKPDGWKGKNSERR